MFYKTSYLKVYLMSLTLVLSCVATLLITYITTGSLAVFTVQSFFQAWIRNWAVGFFVSNIVPLPTLGPSIARKMNLTNPKSIDFRSVVAITGAVLMVFPMVFLLSFFNAGFHANFLVAWLRISGILLVVIFVFLLLFTPLFQKFTSSVCTREPKQQAAPQATKTVTQA